MLKSIHRAFTYKQEKKMAKKRNKIRTERTENTTPSHRNSWPNLPKQLINSIAKQPNLLNNITSFGCIIKSWRLPTIHRTTSGLPRLVEFNNIVKPQRSHKINIPFHEKHPFPYWRSYRYNDWCPGIYFKGFSHGHVMVFTGDKDRIFYLWQPHGMSCLQLPQWDDNIPFRNGAISSFLEYPSRDVKVMILTGISSPAFAFYYCPGNYGSVFSWILQDFKVKDPYAPKENMQFTNGVGFDGKFYALSLQGSIVEIEYVDSCFQITRVGVNRAMPAKTSRQFREYLIESNGEILLVFLISRKSIDVVDDVEVFKLDLDKLLWVKVYGVGERTLFLEDECCMSVDSRTIGCKNNCLYYTHERAGDHQWWIYDMDSGDISRASEIREGVLWDEPLEKIKCCCEVGYRPWLKLGRPRSYFR